MTSRPPPPLLSCQVLDMEEMTIWEQHTATLCKVSSPPPPTHSSGCQREWQFGPHGRTFVPEESKSSSRLRSPLRTPAGASALRSPAAETGRVGPW